MWRGGRRPRNEIPIHGLLMRTRNLAEEVVSPAETFVNAVFAQADRSEATNETHPKFSYFMLPANALYPCVGAALAILAGARSRLLQCLLANRPMVRLGLGDAPWHRPFVLLLAYNSEPQAL